MSKDRSDEALRAAYAARRGLEGAPRRAECPTPEALLEALRGGGVEDERLRLLDHALACPACGGELALLHAVSGSGDARGAPAARSFAWRRLAPLAAAASLVLATGVVAVARLQERGGVYRAPPDNGITLLAPGDGAPVSAGPVELAWRPVPGALRYSVEVTAADGLVLFGAESTDTVVTAQLATTPTGAHSWWVRAHLDDGTERRSPARRLEVR
jgi:hypothetical protein